MNTEIMLAAVCDARARLGQVVIRASSVSLKNLTDNSELAQARVAVIVSAQHANILEHF
jgi:hypothetical protein